MGRAGPDHRLGSLSAMSDFTTRRRRVAAVAASVLALTLGLTGCADDAPQDPAAPDAEPSGSMPTDAAVEDPSATSAAPTPSNPDSNPEAGASSAPPEPGGGLTSGHTGTWAGEPVTGDYAVTDDVPSQPHQFLWYLELPEGAEPQPTQAAGYTIAILPSGCEFRAFQGSVSGQANPDVSDEVGTGQVGDLLRQQFAGEGISDFSDIDPITVSLNHDDGTLELAGLAASYANQDAPWGARTYFRGMPGSDSALFVTLSCAQDSLDAGAAELEALLADSTVVPGP